MVKSLGLQLAAESFRRGGFSHPMGDQWRGLQDLEPGFPSRERLLRFLDDVDVDAILAAVPHGTPKEVAQDIACLHEAGLRSVAILDYGGMAGQEFAASSAAKTRATEDEVLRLVGAAR
jgi:phthiodiolone/phenolphthiodiolone dimycocerosates ketoreductase